MASTPPPVIGKAGNLTVFITPPSPPASPGSPTSEFSTPAATPPADASPASPPPPVETVSPPLPYPAKHPSPPAPPPVQVPPPQFDKAGATGSDRSAAALFWDAVARVREAHASLDEYISNWFGLDQSKYQWALNDYYEITGKEMDSGKTRKPKELSSKMQV